MVGIVTLETPTTLAFFVAILSVGTKQSKHFLIGYCQIFLQFGH
jgi:hypothetical protein